MFTAKNKLFFIFLVICHSAVVMGSENPFQSVNIIQVLGCNKPSVGCKKPPCYSLSEIFPDSFRDNSRHILRPEIDDFSQKKLEQAIGLKVDATKRNIIHASGYECISVLNYLCNSKTVSQKPMIVVLESPRVITGAYPNNLLGYSGLVSFTQQPATNNLSNIPDNVSIIVASRLHQYGYDSGYSEARKLEQQHARFLCRTLAAIGKKFNYFETSEIANANQAQCGCESRLFSLSDHCQGNTISSEVAMIGDILNGIEVLQTKCDASAYMGNDEANDLYDAADRVQRNNIKIVFGNYMLKGAFIALLVYLMHKAAVTSGYVYSN